MAHTPRSTSTEPLRTNRNEGRRDPKRDSAVPAQGITGRDDPYRVDELLGRRVLQHEAAGARLQRLADVLVALEPRAPRHRSEHPLSRVVGVFGP